MTCLLRVFLLLLCGLPLAGWADEVRLEVQIEPARAALKANIEAHVGALEVNSPQQLQRVQRRVEQQAREAGEALGYYRMQVRSELRDGLRLRLQVTPGEPVRLRKVTISLLGPAAELASFQRPQGKALQPGARLDHGQFQGARQLLEQQASRYGFFAARWVERRLQIDPEGGWADLTLIYDSGPRYRFGPVQFSGDAPFADEFLRSLLPSLAGTPYDAERLPELYQALRASDYFASVQVDAEPAQGGVLEVPVQVRLQMRKPRSLGLGLGFSTDVGPRGRFSWERHWASLQGDSYGLESEWSVPRQNIGLWYERPLQPPLSHRLRLAGGYQNETLADTDSHSRLLTLGPEWHRQLESGWQQVLSLKWRRESYRLGDDSGLSSLLMPGLSYSYLRSDNRLDPNRGYRIQTDLTVARRGWLSDTDVLHGNLRLKGLTTLFTNHRLLVGLQLGGSETGEYRDVPASLRFFAGGDQSVRGYDYQSLSPRDADGERVGGRYLLAGSLEYQYRLAEKWRLALFSDQGNAFDSLDLPSLKQGVGLGLRWVSPVGPLRLDLAHALDEPGGWRLHFSMGPEL